MLNATLSGASVGAVTQLKNVSVGGLSVNVSYNILSSRNTEGPITVELVFDKAVYEALKANAVANDGDTWTLTVDGNTWVGSGFISEISYPEHVNPKVSLLHDPSAGYTYTLTITPHNAWTYSGRRY